MAKVSAFTGIAFLTLVLGAFSLFLAGSDGADEGEQNLGSEKIIHSEDLDCMSCHVQMADDLPTAREIATIDCGDCHSLAFLRSRVTTWTHPLKDVALVGKDCLACHTIGEDGGAGVLKMNNRLCLKCHEEVKREFDLWSHHPLIEGLVDCIECHAPHRQRETALLYEQLEVYGDSSFRWHDPLTQNKACLSCHPYFLITDVGSSGFVIANTMNLHEVHLERGFTGCLDCHAPHGSFAPKLIRETTEEGNPLAFLATDGFGTCSTLCHLEEHIQVEYGTDPELLSAR